MGLFSRKKTGEQELNERIDYRNSLVKSIDVLALLATNEENRKTLRAIQDDLRFLAPSVAPEAVDLETRISAKLGDLKISLTARQGADKINKLLNDIKMLLIDRSGK